MVDVEGVTLPSGLMYIFCGEAELAVWSGIRHTSAIARIMSGITEFFLMPSNLVLTVQALIICEILMLK